MYTYISRLSTIIPGYLIVFPLVLGDMATPIRLGTEKSVIPPSEGNVTLAESSKMGAEQPCTKMGENDATKNKKKLTYKDQMYVTREHVQDSTNHSVVTTSKKTTQHSSPPNKCSRNSRNTILVPSAARHKKPSKNKNSRVAIQVRRIYSDRMVYVETKVDIKGKLLLEELKRIHGDTRGVFLVDTSSTVRLSL